MNVRLGTRYATYFGAVLSLVVLVVLGSAAMVAERQSDESVVGQVAGLERAADHQLIGTVGERL